MSNQNIKLTAAFASDNTSNTFSAKLLNNFPEKCYNENKFKESFDNVFYNKIIYIAHPLFCSMACLLFFFWLRSSTDASS